MGLHLRQLCLAASDKDQAVKLLDKVFDMRPVHGSGDLSPYGLPKDGPMSEGGRALLAQQGVENLLFAAGRDFIEIIFPTRTDTTVARFIERRGGLGAGYMVILQDDLAPYAGTAELAKVRIIHEAHYPAYADIQYHPKDAGALLSVSSHLPDNIAGGPWYPAGTAWETMRPSTRVGGIAGARLSNRHPEDLARRWGTLLARDVTPCEGEWHIQMGDTALRFTDEAEGEGFIGVDLHSVDREATLSAAREAGLIVRQDTIQCLGISWHLVA